MVDAKDYPDNSVCAQCARTFHCGMGDDRPCWCAAEFPPVLSGAPDQGCLCPDCLRARIAGRDALPT